MSSPTHPSEAKDRFSKKRSVDFEIIADWVEKGSSVLDLGCGRGVLLEFLNQTKGIYALGVDVDTTKIASCLKRGINAYQGDADQALAIFEPGSFDLVVISRTLEMLPHPRQTIDAALRVGSSVVVGFVNHGFWSNRLHFLSKGIRVKNEVYPTYWEDSSPTNPISISGFEQLCRRTGIHILRKQILGSDWKRPAKVLPSLLGGYAIYQINREGDEK